MSSPERRRSVIIGVSVVMAVVVGVGACSAGSIGASGTGGTTDVGQSEPTASRVDTGTGSDARSITASRVVIGRSVQGREIVANAVGDPGARKVLVVIGSMHGTELGGVKVARRVMKAGAPAGTRIWVVPNLNPDGARTRTRTNARGVDLNRNAPDLWRTGPRDLVYPGPSAASEPETQAMMSFLGDVRPDLVLSFHQALNGVDSYGNKDPRLIKWLGRKFRLPVKRFDCSGICRGTLTGWFNANQPGSAVTIEFPARVSGSRAKAWARSVRQIAAGLRDVA
ncbi:MAG: DUF2817 domain-containing protein [Candidatus Nanopelagicales bacterium]|nr:DUF2817 domain-containing protein [Candidatus Nanopelagicales bacterium]